jgi:colanic acid biosynthesis glycosyl transferase WcaI
MPLRLLIHGINYAPELVGIGRYTGELGAYLAARGHRVTVLTGPPYYPQWRAPAAYKWRWRREWMDGAEVLRAPLYAPARVTGKTRVLHELSFGAACLGWWPQLIRRRWDGVLAVCPLLQSGLMPAWLARRQGIPFIFHFQDLQLDAARDLGILRQPLLLAAVEGLEAWLLRQARMVTTISPAMAARLADKGAFPARLRVLPNWADLEHIRPGPRDNPWRRGQGLEDAILALYAGAMGEKQGLELILDAARRTQTRPDLQYILAGEGGAKARLMAQAAALGLTNLRFLPIQAPEDFARMLAAADIHLVVQRPQAADLVMPSKLANILAAGRPFIATAPPDSELARVTLASHAGVLTPPEDAAALSQAILALAADPAVREDMGRKARRYAEGHLARDVILAGWEALLLELAG